jgi:alginate O-acetyltransferase complex protein AlgJ
MNMKIIKKLTYVAAILTFGLNIALGQCNPTCIGKNGWLFYNEEYLIPYEESTVQSSLDSIIAINKIFAKTKTKLIISMVPIKARLYAEYLPTDKPISDRILNRYSAAILKLNTNGVKTVDLNSAFLNNPKKDSNFPLFLRTDSHWSPQGAYFAGTEIAQKIRTTINISSIPEVKFKVSTGSIAQRIGDLVGLLPESLRPPFKAEPYLPVNFERLTTQDSGLLDAPVPQITVVGTSYSGDHGIALSSGIASSLSRDVLNAPFGGKGNWFPLEKYVTNDAYQTSKPKLIVWELSERSLIVAPNTNWIDTVAPSILGECSISGNRLKMSISSESKTPNLKLNKTKIEGTSNTSDAIRLDLNRVILPADYLSMMVSSKDSDQITIEAVTSEENIKVTQKIVNDGEEHRINISLSTFGNLNVKQVKIYMGNSSKISFDNPKICSAI